MSWLKVEQSLITHRKTAALARTLKISRDQAIGHLITLWSWCLDNADREGNLTGVIAPELADAAHWQGKPEVLLAALKDTGWVEVDNNNIRIHDWQDYTGQLSDKRAENRERQTKYRLRNALRNPSPNALCNALHNGAEQNRVEQNRLCNSDVTRYANPELSVLTNVYEAQGGIISAHSAEQLTDALNEYGLEVLLRSMRIAKANGKPDQISYILGIAKRGGNDYQAPPVDAPYKPPKDNPPPVFTRGIFAPKQGQEGTKKPPDSGGMPKDTAQLKQGAE